MGKQKLQKIVLTEGKWAKVKNETQVQPETLVQPETPIQPKPLTGPVAVTSYRFNTEYDVARETAKQKGVWETANAYAIDRVPSAFAIEFYKI